MKLMSALLESFSKAYVLFVVAGVDWKLKSYWFLKLELNRFCFVFSILLNGTRGLLLMDIVSDSVADKVWICSKICLD